MPSTPNEAEIDEVLNQCAESADEGVSKFPGETFEQGVQAAIEWLRGLGNNPMNG